MEKIYWYLNNNYLKGQNYPHTFNDPLGFHFTPLNHTLFSTTQFLSLKFHRIPPSMSFFSSLPLLTLRVQNAI